MTTDQQPRATLLLIAYRQAQYIEAACRAALAQTYEPLEIILSDDASPDDTFAIMSRIAASYDGPHTVRLNRNSRNLGLIGHINHGLSLATGDMIVVAAGDDVSAPQRVERIMATYRDSKGKAMLVHSAVTNMTPDGIPVGRSDAPMQIRGFQLGDIAERLVAYQGSSGAWNRQLHEHFGDIAFAPAYEDLIFAFRAALLGDIKYIETPLVNYRLDVGISTQDRAATSSLAETRKQRIKSQQIARNVYAQRLKDLMTLPAHPEFARLSKRLARLSEKHAARLTFLTEGLGATLHRHGVWHGLVASAAEAMALKRR